MKVKVINYTGGVLLFDKSLTPKQKKNAEKAAKQALVELYCNKCEVLSSQLEDPSNWGRLYTVEI